VLSKEEKEHPQLDSERHTSMFFSLSSNHQCYEIRSTSNRQEGFEKYKSFFFLLRFSFFSSRDKWHEKESTFIDRMLLNIGDKAHLFLFIVLFGFINIRYVFVCIVYVGDQ
jgi:hypothetical protein